MERSNLAIAFAAVVATATGATPATAQPAPVTTTMAIETTAPPLEQQRGTPLTLADALKAAQPASEQIDAARADVARARAQVESAKSGYYPVVNGSASYIRTIKSQFDDLSFGPSMMEPDPDMPNEVLPFGQRNTWRVGVTAQQPIFDGFRTRANLKQARSGVRQAELGVAATRAQVVLQTAQLYFDAALAQRQVEIAAVTLQQAEQTLKETKLNFEQGAAPEFDLVRAQVARDNEETTLVQFRAQRDVAFVGLRRLVGVPLDRAVALTTTLDQDDLEDVVATALAASGLPAGGTRVAVAQAKEAVAAGRALVDVAKADRLPSLNAASELAFTDFTTTPFNTDWRTDFTVSLNLTIPIFDGWRRRAQVRTSTAQLASARANLAQAGEVASVETAQASASVAASTQVLEASTRTVAQAQRAYQIAELRFAQGASTHLEIVDARVQLEQSLLNQARSSRDLRVARLRQELLPGLPLGAQGF